MREGVTERQLLNRVETEMLQREADPGYNRTEGVLHLCSGKQRAVQYCAVPVDRPIKKGDFVRIDGGAVFKRYVCDLTRSFYFGKRPNTRDQKIMNALIRAHGTIPKTVKPGITSAEIVNAILEVFRDEHVDEHVVRWSTTRTGSKYVIGHNFGLVIHETPYIVEDDRTEYEEKMVFASELLLGEFEEENDYEITRDGCRLMTPLEQKAGFEEGEEWELSS